ncbi:MAG: phospholipid carrier-dependent glycosyltransferase [Chthoniobacterales bacterium]
MLPHLTALQKKHGLPFLISLLAALFAASVYFYGLGSDHIATNGDELVYAQIARATAESGHWLPLQAPIARLQNTKPPLLFWQGIISTDWAKNWTLFHLRWPNVLYTLLTALMIGLIGGGIFRKKERGLLAALLFLSFFGTFRYGRCFLTSAPEVFWLSLPCFLLLAWPRLLHFWRVLPLLGIILGIGLLYKSFTLVVPVVAVLGWWSLQARNYQLKSWIRSDLRKIIFIALVALTIFSLWFFLDPNPQAILDHFILKENLGKFDAGTGNYLFNFFIGSSSIWRNVIAYPLNAGLLAPAVVALFVLRWKNRGQARILDKSVLIQEATEATLKTKYFVKNSSLTPIFEQRLWIWLITIFLVFSLPNQRDERYLLLGMPALALLLASYWERIPRSILALSLAAVVVIAAGLGGLGLLLQHHLAGLPWGAYHYPLAYWIVLVGTMAFALLGLFQTCWTRLFVAPGILLLYLCYACFLWPFDGPLGHFNKTSQELAVQKRIWVPINFNAREESYRFLLPHATALIPYDYKATITIEEMQQKVPRFIISLPLTDQSGENLQNVHLIGRRLNLIDRFNAQETQAMFLGDIAKYLFHQDLLMERRDVNAPSLSL